MGFLSKLFGKKEEERSCCGPAKPAPVEKAKKPKKAKKKKK